MDLLAGEGIENASEFLRFRGEYRVLRGNLDRGHAKRGSESTLTFRRNDLVFGAEDIRAGDVRYAGARPRLVHRPHALFSLGRSQEGQIGFALFRRRQRSEQVEIEGSRPSPLSMDTDMIAVCVADPTTS